MPDPTPTGGLPRVSTGGCFYEEDEPVGKIQAAFDGGEKGVTAAPDCRTRRRCPIPDDPCGPGGARPYCWAADPTPGEDVYRAAAEAYDGVIIAVVGKSLGGPATESLAASTAFRAAVAAAYAVGHVDGAVAERSRLTRIIRRHANSAELPLCNALARIVDEMESVDG